MVFKCNNKSLSLKTHKMIVYVDINTFMCVLSNWSEV